MREFRQGGHAMPGGRKSQQREPLRPGERAGDAVPASSAGEPPDHQHQEAAGIVLPLRHHTQAGSREDQRPVSAPVCPICRGAGQLRKQVPVWHPEFGKAHPCECKKREQREKQRQQMLALCDRFGFQRTQVLGTFQRQVKGVQEAYQEASALSDDLQAWATQRDRVPMGRETVPKRWLVFRGPVGTGKTHLAMAIVNAALEANVEALFATVPDLLDYLRATFDPAATGVYDQLFSKMRDVELLVLDDLGAQRSSPWANEKLFQLLNYRYNFGWPTVITMNAKTWRYLDERISSRLQDAGLVRLIDLTDVRDYRRSQQKQSNRRGDEEATRQG